MIRSIFASSPVGAAVLLTVAVCSALLILPGGTATSMYFNDLLIFLDGGYRVFHGQVPNRDFHTALGPLTFYIPGLGYALSGNLGLAMPVSMAALMLLIAPAMIHVLQSRMRPILAVSLGIFLTLLLATPMNTGEMFLNISFAMFYNRIGWVALGLLLVMHLEPTHTRSRWQTHADIVVAALLTMILLYTKMTYGVVAIAFLLLTLLQARQRLWAAGALAIVLVGGLVAEAFWGGTRQYIDDLRTAARVSGIIEWHIYIRSFVRVSGEYTVFLFFAGLALWHRPRVTDFLFYGFCAASGYALLNQNAQIVGIVTLLVGVAIAAETVARHQQSGTTPLARGASLAAIVLMLPIGLSSAAALGLHAGVATAQSGVALNTPNGTDLRIVNSFDRNHFNLYSNYAETLETGTALLASLDAPPSRVLVMDFVSPFTSLAGISPPEGGSAWMHDNRNFDLDSYLPADEMLGGVDIVMIPRRSIADSTTEKMEEIYGDYLEEHFQLTRIVEHWRLYQRRSPVNVAASSSVGEMREMSFYTADEAHSPH